MFEICLFGYLNPNGPGCWLYWEICWRALRLRSSYLFRMRYISKQKMSACSSEAVLEQAWLHGTVLCKKKKHKLSPKKWRRLPGTPRADVECNFGLWLRLIGAAPLAELAAGRSQARHSLHPQVIQVLWQGRETGERGGKPGGKKEMEGQSSQLALFSVNMMMK